MFKLENKIKNSDEFPIDFFNQSKKVLNLNSNFDKFVNLFKDFINTQANCNNNKLITAVGNFLEFNIESKILGIRCRLIDYSLTLLKFNYINDEIYFTAIEIFDQFLNYYNYNFEEQEIKLIYITSLYMSFKANNSIKFTSFQILNLLKDNFFDDFDIYSTEKLILKKLN